MTAETSKTRRYIWYQTSPLLLWLTVLFFAPVLLIFVRSFWIEEIGGVVDYFSMENYSYFLTQPEFREVLLKSVEIAMSVVAISLLFGYPMAYLVAFRVPKRLQTYALTVLLFPFLTSHIVRIFGWMTILGRSGFINSALLKFGVIDEPIDALLFDTPATVISLSYVLMPVMIMTCYIALSRIDTSLIQASNDLGAGPVRTFFRVTLPLSRPGIVAGFLLVFIPAVGAFFEPLMLGGTRGVMIGNVVANHFTGAILWARGSALAFLVIASIILFVGVVVRLLNTLGRVRRT